MTDLDCMREALILAKQAADLGETPVGCVITRRGEIVGRGCNRRETAKHALAHAELIAIDEACRRLGGWRLWECDLYVTLEPCAMCAGAIESARIRRVFYGAHDPKGGACGSVLNVLDAGLCHKPEVYRGLLADDCSNLLTDFFQHLRKQRTNPKNGQDLIQT